MSASTLEQSSPSDPAAQGLATTVPARTALRLVAWIAAYVLLCVGLLCVGIETAIHFNGPPIDGPFQLYNALRRIIAGQRVGVDFQFFHGAGVPYLHLIPFLLFGRGFFASEVARQVVSVGLFALTFAVVFYAWTRDWLATARLSTAAVLATIVLRLDAIYLPINSLLGVRSTFPILFGVALILPLAPRRRSIIAGAVLGGALLFGTEQGLATIAAFVAVRAVLALRTRRWRDGVEEIALTVGAAAGTYVLVVLALGGWRGLKGAASYNFRLVPMDQFWYFGGPPNRFLSRFPQLLELAFVGPWMLAVVVLMVAALVRAWRMADAQDRRPLSEAVLALYAVISMSSILGVLVTVYLEPAVRISIILVLLAVYRSADRLPLVKAPNWIWRKWRGAAGVLAVLMATLYMRFGALETAALAPLHVVAAHIAGDVPPTMSSSWMEARDVGRHLVDSFTTANGRRPVMWSTYSTIVESSEGLFHPSFDYIIHALGPENRRRYMEAFAADRPDIVQTLKPSYAVYEEWLEANDWPMYRTLFANYRLVAETEWSYFWEPRPNRGLASRVIAEGPFRPDQSAAEIRVEAPADTLTLLEVRMRYHVANPWRLLPVVGSLPRYVVEITGSTNRNAISLAPYETERTFPVIVRGTSQVGLRFSTIALVGGARLIVDSLRVSEVRIPAEASRWARNFSGPRPNPPALR